MPSSTAIVLNSFATPPPFRSLSRQAGRDLEMHMARHELSEGVSDGDDRLAEIAILHAGRAPQAAGARHVAAMSGGA